MTVPGPNNVIACPRCGAYAHVPTVMSFNTFGMRVWSDGRVQLMSEDPPAPVTVCHACSRPYWIRNARQLGTCAWWLDAGTDGDTRTAIQHFFARLGPLYPGRKWGPGPSGDPWGEEPCVAHPTAEQYYRMIADGFARSRPDERELRMLALREDNDSVRGGGVFTNGGTPARRENLERLAELMNANDADERLMKAELLRELGQFEDAIALLVSVVSDSDGGAGAESGATSGGVALDSPEQQDRLRIARIILELAKRGDSAVRDITPEPSSPVAKRSRPGASVKRCSQCGAENPEGADHCSAYGSRSKK